MCGIAGHVVPIGQQPDIGAVSRGIALLAHRGPDGSGLEQFATACLGHRRLSIIDLDGSQQPLKSDNGRYTLVFNGEIYNYLELRQELAQKGVIFRTDGDTEVLLAMYILYGKSCLLRLNGMFAFAIWDEGEHTLFAARDRLGKKPFYFSRTGQGMAFSSEIQPLLGFGGIDTTIDLAAVQEFFAYQFIGDGRSIYRGISKLPAAHWLEYHEGTVMIERYWELPHPGPATNLNSLCEEFSHLMDDAVSLRLRSDVPLGAFLSGGLDSAIILASIKRLGQQVDTFTIGFGGETFDERASAAASAKYFGTHHHEDLLQLDIPAVFEACLPRFGEPFADPSALPTWLVCRQARHYATVALSGDGADELFGGYRRYYARMHLDKLLSIPSGLRRKFMRPLVAALPDSGAYYGASLTKRIKLVWQMLQRLEEAPHDLLPQTFSLSERQRLFSPGCVQPVATDHLSKFGLSSMHPVEQMMLTDTQTYLTDDILVKVDRMSMAHALEVRSPFLDHRIVEFACRLPLEYKIKGAHQKYLLHECFRDQLPPHLSSTKKHGFAVPLADWMRYQLKPLFESLVLDSAMPDFIAREEVNRLWAEHQAGGHDHGFKLWSLLVFHHWYHNQKQP